MGFRLSSREPGDGMELGSCWISSLSVLKESSRWRASQVISQYYGAGVGAETSGGVLDERKRMTVFSFSSRRWPLLLEHGTIVRSNDTGMYSSYYIPLH